jgi:non-heme chloroperoxidase
MIKSLLFVTVFLAIGGPAIAQDLNCAATLYNPSLLVTIDIVRRGNELTLRHARINSTPVVHATLSNTDRGPVFAIEDPKATYALPVVKGPGNIRGMWTQGDTQIPLVLNCRAVAPMPDNSPHTVRFVRTEPGVELEVLDWGGSGKPLILLHGLAGTAHDFDQFGPALAAEYRVIAITRRGSGRSSAPDTGYSTDRLADDVIAVADSLGMVKPVLVGHSLGGADLSAVAARAPERIGGLVYLDAGYPYAYIDSARAGAFETKPEQMYKCPCSIAEKIQNGSRLYSRIPAPALAIFRMDTDWDTPIYSSLHPWTPAQQVQEFERGVPGSRVVRIPNASHIIWESNEAQVLREMRVFIGNLPR